MKFSINCLGNETVGLKFKLQEMETTTPKLVHIASFIFTFCLVLTKKSMKENGFYGIFSWGFNGATWLA